MIHPQLDLRRQNAFTLLEMMISAAAGTILLAALASGAVAIQKSITATDAYLREVNNEGRTMDYVARDLRRALRVGTLVSGAASPLKNETAGFTVTDTRVLTINVPDFYRSNAEDDDDSSDFKLSRYDRRTLDTSNRFNNDPNGSLLNGCIPWAEATVMLNSRPVPRFAPVQAGAGEIQVRYSRGRRSDRDNTICFFRSEYPVNSSVPAATTEIAERVVEGAWTTDLTIFATTTLPDPTVFRLRSKFPSRYSRNRSSAGTEQYVVVTPRNLRRD